MRCLASLALPCRMLAFRAHISLGKSVVDALVAKVVAAGKIVRVPQEIVTAPNVNRGEGSEANNGERDRDGMRLIAQPQNEL